MKKEKIKKIVREGYAKVAKQESPCCSPLKSCGCGGVSENYAQKVSKNVGYSDDEINAVPEGANLGLGCGNPTALASLKEGETVLDLGSGAGFDCFLAAKKVGKSGRVIGIDMTPEMIEKAKENAVKGGYQNVEFRLGEIESILVESGSINAIISNCVINLSPDKEAVFKEAFRVLMPGGRLMLSDIVLLKTLPDSVKKSIEAYVGCLAGAMLKADYLKTINAAGFKEVKVIEESTFKGLKGLAEFAVSIKVSAVKG